MEEYFKPYRLDELSKHLFNEKGFKKVFYTPNELELLYHRLLEVEERLEALKEKSYYFLKKP